MKQLKFNLVIGNHHTLLGCWEQVTITLATFEAAGLDLTSSIEVVPNSVNIIIEEFSDPLVQHLLDVKTEYPDTEYVLYVSEYLTGYSRRLAYLNCFSRSRKFLRFFVSLVAKHTEKKIFGKALTARLLYIIVIKSFTPVAKIFGTNIHEEMMLARRGLALAKLSKSVKCCISTTEAVLETYDTFTDGALGYVPVFVDPQKLIEKKKNGIKAGSIFFSGRITAYRNKILRDFQNWFLNAYPLLSLQYFPASDERHRKALAISKERLSKLTFSEASFSAERFLVGKHFKILEKISDASDDDQFELYVPQDKSWPFSSPNRTLLSLERGFIPVDYGEFNDHDINSLTFNVQNEADLLEILTRSPDELLGELLEKIDAYNRTQFQKALKFKAFLERIFS